MRQLWERLHNAQTVADAPAARQVLKSQIKARTFLTPAEAEEREEQAKAEKVISNRRIDEVDQ